jgi:hypothetical protein
VWVPTLFTKNRERLLEAEVAHRFLAELLNHKQVRGLLSDEHFSVDGTQVAAWTSVKSFRAKDGSDEPPSGGRNGERDFHGEKPSNDTHSSTTDPEARLYRKGKGKEAKLSYIGNALTENRHVLVVAAELGSATGTIEREAAQTMIMRYPPGSAASRSVPTRLTMCAGSSTICATSTSRHTLRRTRPTGPRRSTLLRRAMPVTRSASRSASAPRSRSAGPRPWRPREADAARDRTLAIQVHPEMARQQVPSARFSEAC